MDRQTLIKGLSFNYRTMLASEALLEFAIPRAEGELKAYYRKHLEEERGHDEMLRADLFRLGVREIPFSFAAAAVAGAQYYLIAHEHPAMLLGYMHAMEKGLEPEMVEELCVEHGDLSCLRHHAEHDPYHRQDLERQISALPVALRNRVLWNELNVVDFIEKALA